METAAVLVNMLVSALNAKDAKESLTEDELNSVFTNVHTKRFQRAVDAVNQGRQTTSASIKETFFSRIFVNHFFPRFGQSLIFSLIVKNTLTGPVIQDLPIPTRHKNATVRHERLKSGKSWILWSLISIGAGVLATFMYSTLRKTGPHHMLFQNHLL